MIECSLCRKSYNMGIDCEVLEATMFYRFITDSTAMKSSCTYHSQYIYDSRWFQIPKEEYEIMMLKEAL